MLINDVIRESDTRHEIFFLLTTHVESVRFGDKLGLLPEDTTRLPLEDMRDLQARFNRLLIELDTASKALNYKSCAAIKETLQVFGAGIARLQFIESAHKHSLAHAMRALSQKAQLQSLNATPEQSPSAASDLLRP